jgi:hypothetical protein
MMMRASDSSGGSGSAPRVANGLTKSLALRLVSSDPSRSLGVLCEIKLDRRPQSDLEGAVDIGVQIALTDQGCHLAHFNRLDADGYLIMFLVEPVRAG